MDTRSDLRPQQPSKARLTILGIASCERYHSLRCRYRAAKHSSADQQKIKVTGSATKLASLRSSDSGQQAWGLTQPHKIVTDYLALTVFKHEIHNDGR